MDGSGDSNSGARMGWAAIEIACKPCLEKGSEAINRSVNPDYDPDNDDDNNIRAPLNPNPPSIVDDSDAISTSSPSLIKAA